MSTNKNKWMDWIAMSGDVVEIHVTPLMPDSFTPCTVTLTSIRGEKALATYTNIEYLHLLVKLNAQHAFQRKANANGACIPITIVPSDTLVQPTAVFRSITVNDPLWLLADAAEAATPLRTHSIMR